MAMVEQLDTVKGLGLCLIPPPGAKRLLKKMARRSMRREAKRDPENAPKKLKFRGWYW
jgi:hypothetical protein